MSLPLGDNKSIGSYANESTGKFYTFIYNSLGNHTINEYDTVLNNITIILQGSFLNFKEFDYINGVGIVDNKFLYWTDGVNPPRGIDIEKSKTSNYYIDSKGISLIKQPPQELIACQYKNDLTSNTAQNRLIEQLFQFRYLYVYEDGSRSSWSSCSKLPLPSITSGNANDSAQNNNIELIFNVGTKYVKSIEIAAQVKGVSTTVNTTDWFSILSVDRSFIVENANYEYDSLTNLAKYNFYNDGLYQSISILETDQPYNYVPLKSKALDVVNGNVLVLGNNTEGYDNIDLNADVYVDYINPQIDGTSPVVNNEKVSFYLNANVNQGTFTGLAGTQTYYQLTDDSTVLAAADLPLQSGAGDGFFFITDANSPSQQVIPSGNFEFEIYLDVAVVFNLTDFAALFSVYKYNGTTFTLIAGGPSYTTPMTTNGINSYKINIPIIETQFSITDRIAIRIENTGNTFQLFSLLTQGTHHSNFKTTIPKVETNLVSKASYKTNSKYQFGLVYYDEFNRSSYVQTNQSLIIDTNSWGETEGKIPSMGWTIRNQAPLWATKYQWVRTEQLTHQTFLYWVASAFNAPVDKDYYELTITSFLTYNENNPNSILKYDWAKGDRCTIHKQNATWVNDYDVAIVGTEVTDTSFILQIDKKYALTPGAAGILLEIYTPKTRSNSSTEQFFYEFGEQYSCLNGVHSITSNSFTEGDVYVKKRAIPGYGTPTLEDPNFSDFYKSNYSSNGRANIFAPQAKQLTLPTDVRYSDTYVPNTNINGLSTFYGDAFETYDRVNGSIQKLAVRDNYIVTFQELKTGYIPVMQSVIEDQGTGNTANVAISNKLLNKIRYYAGDFGIGLNPESFARFAGTMYFVDPNRGFVLKLNQGLQPISSIGMDSYFTKKLSEARSISNTKLIGSYDPRNDEYIFTTRYVAGGVSETIAFNENINRWTSFYSFIPEHANYIFNKYFSFKNGTMWEHNINNTYNSFYGVTYSSIVQLTYNSSPTLIKSFLGIMQQSNTAWSIPTISTSLVMNSSQQSSSLIADDFVDKEGVWFSSFLRDANSFGGLIEGDDLKGNWIKLRLSNNYTGKINLLSIDVRQIPSYQGIK